MKTLRKNRKTANATIERLLLVKAQINRTIQNLKKHSVRCAPGLKPNGILLHRNEGEDHSTVVFGWENFKIVQDALSKKDYDQTN